MTNHSADLLPDLNPETHAQMYDSPRAFTEKEGHHPLAEKGWHVLGHTVLDNEPDTLLLESGLLEHSRKRRVLELFDDYAWAQNPRLLEWQAFLDSETEKGDRSGWAQSIAEKLEAYGVEEKEPHIWLALNRDFDGDWLLGLEF